MPPVPEKQQSKPKQEQEIESSIKPEWFDAYLEGNMRVPQIGFGVTMFLLNAFFRDNQPDITRLHESSFSQNQLEKVKDAMHTAHSFKHIPAGIKGRPIEQIIEKIKNESSDKTFGHSDAIFFNNDRFKVLWGTFVNRSLYFLKEVVSKRVGRNLNIENLKLEFSQNPNLIPELRLIFSSAVEALRSDEGKRLTLAYRDNFDLKKHGQPPTDLLGSRSYYNYLQEKATESKKALFEFVFKYVADRNPDWPLSLNDFDSTQ